MDEVDYVTATRLLKQFVVTVSVENISFVKPFGLGDIIEINGSVTKIGSVKVEVSVMAYRESTKTGLKEKSASSKFYFTAVDESNRPVRNNYSLLRKSLVK